MSLDDDPTPLPPAMLDALCPEDVEREMARWSALSASQRKRAVDRLDAITRWRDGRGDVDVDGAARIAGMSVSRFYRIASAWRGDPGFEALGVFASARERKPKVSHEVVESLTLATRKAILLFGQLPVSALAKRALQLAKLPDGSLPKTTKLREIVQAELHRMQFNKPRGQVILFDCVATSMPAEDGRPHIGYFCIDEGTATVLGVAIGAIGAVVDGYAAAASDAYRNIEENAGDGGWSNVFLAARLTAGEDVGQLLKLTHRLNATFLEQHFITERDADRYGRLLARTVGPRLGRVTFTPSRTVGGTALATNGDMTPWSPSDARAALRRAADEYNAGVPTRIGQGAVEPPPHLMDALAIIAGSRG